MTAAATEAESLLAPRWRGERGRLEVWYTTLTDPATGTGVWLHHEVLAPSDGGPATAHGWAAVFPPDRPPVFGRFRGAAPPTAARTARSSRSHATPPTAARATDPGRNSAAPPTAARTTGPRRNDAAPPSGRFFTADGTELTAAALRGRTADGAAISWELAAEGGGEPLFTFPRWAWQRQVLPAAQIVPQPAATFTGVLSYDGAELPLRSAPGGTAHIYGHGNARRWAWLHADLGGGDVCEVVAAVSTRPLLRWLPPLPFVRLRVGGLEWPEADPLAAAIRMRARIDLPKWTVTGRSGDRRLRVDVVQPPERTVAVDYTNPDGTAAVCRNSERADATLILQRRYGRDWRTEHRWRLDGTAHAEVGSHA